MTNDTGSKCRVIYNSPNKKNYFASKTKDRIKEEIGFEKLLLTLLVAIISSLSSWTWSNKKFLLEIMTNALYLFCVVFTIVAFSLFLKIKLKIKELDNYES